MRTSNALSLAIDSLAANDMDKAEAICAEILQDDPRNARAWHLRGIIHAQQGQLQSAVDCFSRATKHDPNKATYHYNLGLAFARQGQTEQAIEAYQEAVGKKNDFLEARNNLGNALTAAKRNREAIECFRELVKCFPDSADSVFNLANVLQDTGHVDEAITAYRRALELEPGHTAARENVGQALTDEDRSEEAQQVWSDWLGLDPNSAVARHMLASVSGQSVPEKCDDGYVCETFDRSFARTFDRQLARLNFQAPALIGQALRSIQEGESEWDVLDAGCGTGLCGPLIRPHARKLVGVDLSKDMLAEAEKRDEYDELVTGELTSFMATRTAAFDAVVSSDTFCYFGNLKEVFAAAQQTVREQGFLIFTVELIDDSSPDESYRLQPHGRYCHTEHYVSDSLSESGFDILDVKRAVLRQERGSEVAGLVVTAQRLCI